jgi:hypothetical protein
VVIGVEAGRSSNRYCTTNRGFHHTAKAALACPYHRAVALAADPTLDVSATKRSGSRNSVASNPPPGVTLVVDTPAKSPDASARRDYLDGGALLHRDDGPASITFISENDSERLALPRDTPKVERWLRKGVPYRADGGPTSVRYKFSLRGSHTGMETWQNEDGQMHRDNDLPARVHGSELYERYINGNELHEWYINGKRHREGNRFDTLGNRPTTTNGDGAGVEWSVEDQLHRIDGPAINGDGAGVEWYLNGLTSDEMSVYAQFLVHFGVDVNNRAAQEFLYTPTEAAFYTPTEAAFAEPDQEDITLALALHNNPPRTA